MTSVQTHLKNLGRITFLVMFFALFLQGCMPQVSGKKTSLKSASTDTATGDKVPEFTTGTNFIQNGPSVFLSTIKLDMSFSDSIWLRGKDVDSYIRATGTSNVACLTSRFETTNRIILLAAIPRSIYNFTTQTTEYYYNIAPTNTSTNQSFCQKTGLINQLSTTYAGYTPKYTMADVCPTGSCNVSTYAGKSLELYNASGIAITQVATKQLSFLINNNPVVETPTGLTCTDSSQCTAQGFSCCSSGQCVNDLAQKPGIDTSSEYFLQAVQDILNNPAAIYSYPQYYFICSTPVVTPTTPVETTDPATEAALRIKRLEDLYMCTNKIEGEYGVCTVKYDNVLPNDGKKYSAGKDDRSFSQTFTNIDILTGTLVSIEKIIYGGIVMYDYTTKDPGSLLKEPYEDDAVHPAVAPFRITGGHNDFVDSAAYVEIFKKPESAESNTLEIKYKIDASCTLINNSLAKCEKYYVQGQKNSGDTPAAHLQGRVTDHHPGNGLFKIPAYANTIKAITVEVDGLLQKLDIDWVLVPGAQSSVQFIPANSIKVSDGQKVKISYFVDIDPNPLNPSVISSKRKALEEIKTLCSCADLSCSLTPVKNASNKIVDYACVYPDPAPVEPPVSQKVYVSSKAVPVRFFDKKGTSQKSVVAGMEQEGIEFTYTNGDLLKPTNLSGYIGFNEIYGSISYANGSAKPASEINVKKGNYYDIYVDRGSFSNCIQCGNDYYSQLNKLFPLTQFGGGVVPLLGQTNRTMSSGVRSDDLKFGRACVVPATMIPWSHAPELTVGLQRENRMRAQHFQYANGYQYDWYGFDYGSVIGSFDGVKWFSIGTNRRIKAESSKMFVAINGAMGDLTLETTYEVTVNDGSLNPLGTNLVTSDFNSDGAECQQFHQCSTDNDCATTLGWEYACAPVSEITTSWPKFDDNGKELAESLREDNRLTAILGVSNAGKRCVYRGRGALCSQNYASNAINVNTTFNQSTNQAMHSCSDNTYCQAITTNGTGTPNFNNRIVRYGKVRTDNTVDTFGLGALVPGRPFAWNGQELPHAGTLKNLNSNRALAMCIPGRDIEKTSFLEQNRSPLTTDYKGDKVLGIGMTHKASVTAIPNYLNACSIMDSSRNFYHNTAASPSATFNSTNYENLKFDAGSQAVSTNSLTIFNNIFNSKGITFGLIKPNTALLNTVSFTENSCMRAPAASCFSDLDCSPSKVISDKLKSISADDTSLSSILNKYEIKFWQEELICSQPISKTSLSYDPKNNYCCRDVGNIISLPSADIRNGLDYKRVAGIDMPINEALRYTRAATMYKEVNKNGVNFPELRTAIANQCTSPAGCQPIEGLNNQFRTFAAFAEKTSCSGDWVRSFATGTHKWEVGRFQTFSPSTFQCMNWYPGTGGYTCAGIEADDPSCPMAQTSPTTAKGKEVLNYMAKLELMGIPQIYFEPESYFSGATENSFSCKSAPGNRNGVYPGNGGTNYAPPAQLFTSGAVAEYTNTPSTQQFLSAIDPTNFKSMKQVFKADEVVSCLPAGTDMKVGDDPARCCTGMINASTLKCQLPDYIDVSIYTNRYVSSEAKKLNISLFDQNGYIKDAAYAAQIACEKSMCASGTLAYGVLISRLPTPGQTESENKYYRFLEGNTVDNTNGLLDLYNKGLKLNNHIYCVPKSLQETAAASGAEDLTIISCGN